jgi:hypothetical protein
MIHGLKLKWDTPREKTIHDDTPVFIGFMLSLSVLKRLLSF